LKLEWRTARSKVARRVVALFVFGALVPLVATAALSYWQVRGVLVERGYVDLARLAASHAATLNDRLASAAERLRAAGDHPPREKETARLRERFDAIAVHRPDGTSTHLFGASRPRPDFGAAEQAQLRGGESVLRTRPAASGTAVVTLATAVDPGRPEAGIAVGELESKAFWGDADDLAALTDFSVADERGRLLFTSLGDARDVLAAIHDAPPRTTNGRLTFSHRDAPQIAQFRELFLQPHYLTKGWTVYASRPEEDLLAPLERFQALFAPTVAFTLFGVALLALTQVRRTLVPLERLLEGTRRVARQEFGTPVVVDGDDEFGELAQSFNAMSNRLERQFSVLATLADVDRAILSRPDVAHVIETILERMSQIVPACDACIAVFDHRDPTTVGVYTRRADGDGPASVERVPRPASGAAEVAAAGDAWLAAGAGIPTFARPLQEQGATALYSLPIAWRGSVVAIMLLGARDRSAVTDESLASARSLADRVGVAFAAAAREEQLYYQAHYDSLTGLPNRLYFKDQLAGALTRAHRGRRQLSLLYIDLDHFKSVNDSLGHAVGDDVLQQAALRLRGCVRETDIAARLGGDEFTLILPEIVSSRDPQVAADHVIAAMSRPFSAAGQELFLNASIGIAVYPDDGATAEDLLRNADTAMYRAKDAGRGRAMFFEEQMNVAALARVHTERDLRHAIERKEFVLHYQPVIDVASGRAVGVEALVRWRHPERGLLGPRHFVDLAEQTGVVNAMGDWVLAEALERFAAWRAGGIALDRVAVNVSPRQFRQPDLADKVARALRDAGLPPSMLELEITESLLLEATGGTETMIGDLKAMGVQIALDDFGTGYSSLAYLQRFPVDVVKIDGIFVKDLPADGSSAAIVRAIVSMGHALGKVVVAEGVASAAQMSFLVGTGCDRLQGFHLSEPLPPAAVEAFLREYRVGPRRGRVHAA
jgi:diguanylate cyclase (GGDEF)-like protein